MLGMLVGTLCLIALIATVRRRRYARFFDDGDAPFWDGVYDGYGCHGVGRWHRRRARGRRRQLYGLFRRLDTTPGQEKAIAEWMDGVRTRLSEARGELATTRRELAAALGGEVLDAAALDAAFRRADALYARLSKDVQQALAGVHETLDPEQRRQLAELLADGSFSSRFYAPHPAYRC